MLLSGPPAVGAIDLTGPEAHHVGRVLRARAGEAITATDGRGARYRGLVRCVERDRVSLDLALIGREAKGRPEVTVLLPVLPADRMADAVDKIVELGASRIVPVTTARTQPRDRARLAARLRGVVWSATEQSRRAWLPVVDEVMPLEDALDAAPGLLVAADAELGAPARHAFETPIPDALTLVTGPEGGFDRLDREILQQHQAMWVRLGDGVLRAETAAIVLVAIASFQFLMLDTRHATSLE